MNKIKDKLISNITKEEDKIERPDVLKKLNQFYKKK